MTIRQFSIVLDNVSGNYFPGDVVSGKVLLWLDTPKDIKGIKLKIGGKAYVHWTRTRSSGFNSVGNKNSKMSHSERVHYSAEERYVQCEQYLDGGEHCKITIAAGYEHVYHFAIGLPPYIPSSFEGNFGYIRYSISVRLVKHLLFDAKEKILFNIYNPIDLNLVPSAGLPLDTRETKTFFTPFSSTCGPLTMTVNVPQSGYVPVQDIPVTITVINESNFVVDSIQVKFMKREDWFVTHPRSANRFLKTKLFQKPLTGVGVKESKTFLEILNFGHIAVENLSGCSIINVTYYLKVEACMRDFFRKGLKAKVPLILGAVPLRNGQLFHPNTTDLLSATSRILTISSDSDPPPYDDAIRMPQLLQDGSYLINQQNRQHSAIVSHKTHVADNSVNETCPNVESSDHIYPSVPTFDK